MKLVRALSLCLLACTARALEIDDYFDRLDEYAVRVTPWDDGRFNLQVGKFATVVGNFVLRHLSWENPFIDAPLVYENLTAVSDKAAPASPRNFVHGFEPAGKYEFNPVIW